MIFYITKQTIMRIKLTIVALTLSLMQVSASGYAQRISLSKKNLTLQQFFRAVKAQVGYNFLYEPEVLKSSKTFNIDIRNEELQRVLEEVFANQPLTYTIEEKTIVVKARNKSFLEILSEMMQRIDISGRVFDEKGFPLPGATIKLKGTGRTAVTDEQGQFALTNVDPGSVLTISYLGYKPKEITVKSNEPQLTVTLEINPAQLDSVTVVSTGYQTLSKERATGAYHIVSGAQLNRPATNISQRLIGTTAGMQAFLDADGNPRFEIRGQTSLNTTGSAARPLVVVDGFAVQGDFTTINPNDVESITVLKDAAAASIWGARAANGVIVVITKNARKDTPLQVSFSAFTRLSAKVDLDYVNPLASSGETVDYETKAFGNWSAQSNPGSLSNYYFAWSPATVALNEYQLGYITAAQRDELLDKYRGLSNKDQIRDELLTNPLTTQYNLNLSGASERMRNSLSLLFEDTKSNFKGTENKKYNLSFRSEADIRKWLTLTVSGMAYYNQGKLNGVSLSDIQNISPYEMLRNEDGSLTDINQYYTPILNRLVPTSKFPYADWTYNPVQEIANRKVTSDELNMRIQTGLRFKLLKGLTFDSKIQYELFNTFNRGYYNENTFRVRNAVNTAATWDQASGKITLNLPKGGLLTQSRNRAETYNFRNQLNFDRRFSQDHELNIVAGSETNNIVQQSFGNPITYGFDENTLSVASFPNGPGGTFYQIKNWLGNNQTFAYVNSFAHSTDRYFSLFGNAAYTYQNKYTLSGSIRTDASNLITDDPAYRYAPFWSAGLGWQAGKERFLQDQDWLDRLTVRATYGYNGNVDKSTSFRPLIAMGAASNVYTGDFTASVSSFGNPTLRWEKTGTINLGLDYSIFRGALYGKIDYYEKYGKDLIATLSIPAANGTTSQRLNNAEMTNKGIEIELGTVLPVKDQDIVWRGNLTFAYNNNRITKLFVTNYAASTLVGGGSGAYVEGENANALWRFRYAGLQNSQPMVYGANGALYDFGAFTPGDGRDYLLNVGTSVAPYTLGFVNSFKLYDFDLSFIVTGKFGHVFQRKGFNYPPTWTTRVLPNNKISEVINGDPQQIVPLPQNLIEPRYYFWDRFHQNLSYLIESASHIRMQEVNLSYNIPAGLLGRTGLKRMQVFAQGNDLFTIISNNAGEDPEYPLGTFKPQPRVSLGLQCQF